MDLTRILKNIEKHVTLDSDEIGVIESHLIRRSVNRKQVILRAGDACTSIFYVDRGGLRAYHTDSSGNENIVMFAINDWWVTDMFSFTSGKPAIMSIDALEDTDLLELKRSDFETLLSEVPKIERFFRIIFQNAYVREQLRLIQNLSQPAEERYNSFLQKYPQFVERVTLKQIASYLGITPEFLSVLRKKRNRPENS
jgi:CRP-like cAMP-binding protein